MTKIQVGTKFRSVYADGNCLWEVKSSRGRGAWNCEIVPEELDYAGTKKVFGTEEIQSSLQMEAHWKQTSDASDRFYRNQPIGTIVHYSNGHGTYVRCKVTSNNDLLPIALVGSWREYDLPRRAPNGTITNSYHVEKIKKKETFKPHASNIYEFQHQLNAPDPSKMTPINYELPPMTPEETIRADKQMKLEHLQTIVNNNDSSPDEIFNRVKHFLDPNAI